MRMVRLMRMTRGIREWWLGVRPRRHRSVWVRIVDETGKRVSPFGAFPAYARLVRLGGWYRRDLALRQRLCAILGTTSWQWLTEYGDGDDIEVTVRDPARVQELLTRGFLKGRTGEL